MHVNVCVCVCLRHSILRTSILFHARFFASPLRSLYICLSAVALPAIAQSGNFLISKIDGKFIVRQIVTQYSVCVAICCCYCYNTHKSHVAQRTRNFRTNMRLLKFLPKFTYLQQQQLALAKYHNGSFFNYFFCFYFLQLLTRPHARTNNICIAFCAPLWRQQHKWRHFRIRCTASAATPTTPTTPRTGSSNTQKCHHKRT